jgi:cbb3-type cytochrome oxidase maturation protein
MSIIYLLLPLAFALGLAAVLAFVRATRAGQFDDLETPAHRILHDDERVAPVTALPAQGPATPLRRS